MPHAAQHEPHFQTLNIYWGEIATPETINRENVGGNRGKTVWEQKPSYNPHHSHMLYFCN